MSLVGSHISLSIFSFVFSLAINEYYLFNLDNLLDLLKKPARIQAEVAEDYREAEGLEPVGKVGWNLPRTVRPLPQRLNGTNTLPSIYLFLLFSKKTSVYTIIGRANKASRPPSRI